MPSWKSVWRQRAESWTFARLDDGNSFVDVAPEACYLTGVVRSAAIRDARKGPKSFFGTVHSYASIGHYDERAEFATVTTPSHLQNVDAQHLDSVVVLDQIVFGPVPFRGGSLELEVGVFSIEARDLTGAIIDLLDTMATAAGVSFVDVAKPFVSPLLKGLGALTGLDDQSVLEIGLAKTFTSPQAGDYLVIRAPRGSQSTAGWRIDPDGSLVDQAGTVVPNLAYLVFGLIAEAERSDWFEIPEIRQAHQRVREAVRTGRLDRVKEAIGAFKLIAMTSGDLLAADASRLCEKVEAAARSALPAEATKLSARDIGSLEEIALYS